ncbi:hypothetical protein GCM10018963_13450 [Saccharothrix longispora]
MKSGCRCGSGGTRRPVGGGGKATITHPYEPNVKRESCETILLLTFSRFDHDEVLPGMRPVEPGRLTVEPRVAARSTGSASDRGEPTGGDAKGVGGR